MYTLLLTKLASNWHLEKGQHGPVQGKPDHRAMQGHPLINAIFILKAQTLKSSKFDMLNNLCDNVASFNEYMLIKTVTYICFF